MYIVNQGLHECGEEKTERYLQLYDRVAPLCSVAVNILFHEVMDRFNLPEDVRNLSEASILMHLDQV